MAIPTAGLLALSGVLATASPAAAGLDACEKRNDNTVAKLVECVTVDGVLEHQKAFQSIADAHDDNRASGTPGYDASVNYVAQRLEAAGYSVSRQEFSFPFFQLRDSSFSRVAPTATTYRSGTDYAPMTYTGAGAVEAGTVTPVDLDSGSSGCDADDFIGFTAGDVALVQRGALCLRRQGSQRRGGGGLRGRDLQQRARAAQRHAERTGNHHPGHRCPHGHR